MQRSIIILSWLLICNLCSAQSSETSLKITPLTGDFYVYTTYNYYKGNKIGANGMYIVTNEGVVLIDSPWDTLQFQPLLDTISVRHNKKVVMCIATHFHEDRTGGLSYYASKGIRTYTTKKTDSLSAYYGMPRAEYLIEKDTVFNIGQYSFNTFFPGHGHAPDNIVILFKNQKIAFGGCLIKSTDDSSLGNLNDASIIDYAATVQKVSRKTKRYKWIIPGHNGWSSVMSVKHTLEMAKRLKKR